MAIDLLLVRHGQTDWNPIGRVMGRSRISLNAAGIAQAENLREWLKNIEIHAVYSSPLPRAMETAKIILEGRGAISIKPEEGVTEIDYGDWVGITFKDLEEKFNQAYNDYRFRPSQMKVPGGETVVGVQQRAVGAVEKMRGRHEGQRVLVVSHADVIKAILVHYLGFPLDWLQKVGCDNGSLSIYRFGTEWGDRLVALNYFADVKKILPW